MVAARPPGLVGGEDTSGHQTSRVRGVVESWGSPKPQWWEGVMRIMPRCLLHVTAPPNSIDHFSMQNFLQTLSTAFFESTVDVCLLLFAAPHRNP